MVFVVNCPHPEIMEASSQSLICCSDRDPLSLCRLPKAFIKVCWEPEMNSRDEHQAFTFNPITWFFSVQFASLGEPAFCPCKKHLRQTVVKRKYWFVAYSFRALVHGQMALLLLGLREKQHITELCMEKQNCSSHGWSWKRVLFEGLTLIPWNAH